MEVGETRLVLKVMSQLGEAICSSTERVGKSPYRLSCCKRDELVEQAVC